MLGKVELCLQEMGLRLVWSGEGMAVLKVKDSVLKLVDNSPHSGWLPYEHLTTLALLGKRNLAELLADGHVLFCPEVATSLLPQDSADPIFALEPLEDNRWCVRTSNLVGFLECNGLTISIGSRFDSEDGSSFFLPYLIARTLHIPPLELDWEQVSAYDLLPLLFPAALTRALGSGLFKQYQRVSTNGSCFKSSLAVAAHLKHNLTSGLVSGRASGRKVTSVSSQLSADNAVTQLIRHTIELIRSKPALVPLLAVNASVVSAVRQIELATPSFRASALVSVVKANRAPCSSPAYRPLQQLCLKLLMAFDPSLSLSQDSDQVYGVLFDISYLWEEYLAMLLEPVGFEHPRNKAGVGALYLDRDQSFLAYPDFYRLSSDSTLAEPRADLVLDAKFKRYDTYAPARDDIVQMLTYLHVLKAPRALLLCPTQRTDPLESHYEFCGLGGTVDVAFLPIPAQAESFADFCAQMAQAEAELLASLAT